MQIINKVLRIWDRESNPRTMDRQLAALSTKPHWLEISVFYLFQYCIGYYPPLFIAWQVGPLRPSHSPLSLEREYAESPPTRPPFLRFWAARRPCKTQNFERVFRALPFICTPKTLYSKWSPWYNPVPFEFWSVKTCHGRELPNILWYMDFLWHKEYMIKNWNKSNKFRPEKITNSAERPIAKPINMTNN